MKKHTVQRENISKYFLQPDNEFKNLFNKLSSFILLPLGGATTSHILPVMPLTEYERGVADPDLMLENSHCYFVSFQLIFFASIEIRNKLEGLKINDIGWTAILEVVELSYNLPNNRPGLNKSISFMFLKAILQKYYYL